MNQIPVVLPETIGRRFTESARYPGSVVSTAAMYAWFAARGRANAFAVQRIPFDALEGWNFAPDSGNLVHRSGRFFSIEGLRVETDYGPTPRWDQAIINQPEIGILGILVKEFDGVLHCLMQAKMEPGNLNTIQLSPTVQATRSNYTRVHQGSGIRYLEYFARPDRGKRLVDSLQSEQAAWFFRKRNRNMIVEVTEDIEVGEDYCWLTIGQVQQLLHHDNVVNMDTRTVLSCIGFASPDLASGRGAAAKDPAFTAALARSVGSEAAPLHTTGELQSWFTEVKVRHLLRSRLIPLDECENWKRGAEEIAHDEQKYFSIVAVSVDASNREVAHWTQPLLAPRGPGLAAFFTKVINGTLHILVQARVEPGCLDVMELAPTVQCTPGNYADVAEELRPAFLDQALHADPARIRYDAVHSDEGGRFYQAASRHLVIDAGDDLPAEIPDHFQWVTVGQLSQLLRRSYCLNLQTRSLLACVQSLW